LTTLAQRAAEFVKANPQVLTEFVREARGDLMRGAKRLSAKDIGERLRKRVETSGEGWRINNSYITPIARMAVERNPEFRGLFEFRSPQRTPVGRHSAGHVSGQKTSPVAPGSTPGTSPNRGRTFIQSSELDRAHNPAVSSATLPPATKRYLWDHGDKGSAWFTSKDIETIATVADVFEGAEIVEVRDLTRE